MVKSLIHVCVPVSCVTLTSVIEPGVGTVTVDVMVGVPLAEIVTGTFVLLKVEQFAVVKLNVDETGPVPQAV